MQFVNPRTQASQGKLAAGPLQDSAPQHENSGALLDYPDNHLDWQDEEQTNDDHSKFDWTKRCASACMRASSRNEKQMPQLSSQAPHSEACMGHWGSPSARPKEKH
ncbi:hypothetical protein M758_9G032100 [Ceratodon purpureus]|uniref:Uncharacterized protein n=1 Tax=Ceratodon purpureus TaxID=3225 RepID=A0A8T0GRR0_CERPU|nr:hypothetical protein KC19_9G030200 [Ceratodon purpureus]KAG0605109.1 hypothetical protein M758_9G032100 [Ceratodon purpureus]